jgi:hypothetical protein
MVAPAIYFDHWAVRRFSEQQAARTQAAKRNEFCELLLSPHVLAVPILIALQASSTRESQRYESTTPTKNLSALIPFI